MIKIVIDFSHVISFLSVLQALLALVHDPEPEHPLRGDLAELYSKNKKQFLTQAREYTKKHAEKRPT